jgi:hypothetical protein
MHIRFLHIAASGWVRSAVGERDEVRPAPTSLADFKTRLRSAIADAVGTAIQSSPSIVTQIRRDSAPCSVVLVLGDEARNDTGEIE